ncbi:MAG: hypothetical protein KA210_01620 [Bacteroidia bacterium]|nr:hypothetical protein [Bacteroidia bacterium]
MNLEELSYPIYRKRKNDKSFYKIISFNQFEEIQKMGSKLLFYSFTISKYPEKLLLMDMISMKDYQYEEILYEEWNLLLSKTGTV